MTEPLPKIETFRSASQNIQSVLAGLVAGNGYSTDNWYQLAAAVVMIALPMIDTVFQQWQLAQKKDK